MINLLVHLLHLAFSKRDVIDLIFSSNYNKSEVKHRSDEVLNLFCGREVNLLHPVCTLPQGDLEKMIAVATTTLDFHTPYILDFLSKSTFSSIKIENNTAVRLHYEKMKIKIKLFYQYAFLPIYF